MLGVFSSILAVAPAWLLILAGFAIYFYYTRRTVGAGMNPETRRHLDMLREASWRENYAAIISTWLDCLDGFWSKGMERPGPPDRTPLKREIDIAFSHGLLNFTLIFALAYPVASLLAHWLATGEAQTVGGVTVMPASAEWWDRPATIGGLAIVAYSVWKSHSADRTGASGRQFLWIAFAVAAAVAGAFAGSGSGARVVAFAIAVAGAFAGSGSGARVVAFAFAVAAAGAVRWLGRRTGRQALALFLWALVGVAAICVAVTWSPEMNDARAGAVVFIGLLPLLNGITDFLSTGATRFLLRRAELMEARWARVALWFADAVVALATLALLVGSFIAIVALIRPESGRPLINILDLLFDIRAHPENYYWLAFMVLTTLLPSLLHLIVAAYSIFLLFLPRWRESIAVELDAGALGDGERGSRGRLALVALLTCAWGVPTVALWYILNFVWSERVGLRHWALDRAEDFTLWVGAFA